MTGSEIVAVIVVVVLVAFAAVLALAETALTHLTRARAVALEEEGRRGASMLRRLLEQREQVLNPVLLLSLTSYLAAATIIGALAQRRYGFEGVVAGFAVALLSIFVLAVAIPKTWALQHADRAGLFVAPIVTAIVKFPPLRWVTRGLIGISNIVLPGKGRPSGPSVSEEELLAFAAVAARAEAIDVEEQELIESIIEFGDTIVREVMVPRPDMVTIDAGFGVADMMEVSLLNGYSRIPVCGSGIDDVVGVVYAKDLMKAERDGHTDFRADALARDAHFVPETKRVAELLPEMQANQFHIAIVIDEYGGTAGLVTLEDLIEELVGEIVDEFDKEEAMIEPQPGGAVRVNARMAMDELNELLGAEMPEGDWNTVGGLMFHLLGHVPVEGETAVVGGHQLRAERVQGRRIGRVRITEVRSGPGLAAEGAA
jgi:CBS domain containing-hemolysin-like protein